MDMKRVAKESGMKRYLVGAGLLVLFAVLAFDILGTIFVLSVRLWDRQPEQPKSEPDYQLLAKMKVVATAYSSEAAQTDDSPCLTANGFNVCAHYSASGTVDTVAANFLPINSIIKIPELFGDQKVFVVRDRMNSRYGPGRIDLWMPERDDAVEFGKRPLVIEVYK
ncbi:MAG: hypothetical protein WCW31_03830 [Patescibacteria group bacterium]|jgi:3D (Asp-Asp-Asp) domain-containing protein